MRLQLIVLSSVNGIQVIFQLRCRWISLDATSCSDGQEVGPAGELCLKKAAGSFPGSLKPAGLVAHESKCPVLRPELVKSENGHLFGSR